MSPSQETGWPLLDIVSYGRRAPSTPLTRGDIERIRRTVFRVPEVMIKVTTGRGATRARGVAAHFNYIGRRGTVEIETDDGDLLTSTSACQRLLAEWDIDLEESRPRADLVAREPRKRPKLVHRLVFSMPAGTPALKLRAAVRAFARDEFANRHRYVMVLHTDEPHPHVHMVVKAMSEEGQRLNIQRETLRRWRVLFARNLRARGVAANATSRFVRGQPKTTKLDGIYRAAARGESTHMRRKAEEAMRGRSPSKERDSSAGARLRKTQEILQHSWLSVAKTLSLQNEHGLANNVQEFIAKLPFAGTEQQLLKDRIHEAQRKSVQKERKRLG